ncbi:MAG: type II toxin-antitoxin system VapB family antitoxin [Chitinispirillales bacterium]|jgi:Arc/MetJ family transcription regulator|nr:type II toxin-antitoxin system VapB family antitoxin [Chitinispirillales bacterium]
MPVQFDVDESLLTDAIKIGGFKTRDDAVNVALKEFIGLKKRQEAMDLLWQVDFDEDWSPQKARGKV